MPDHPTLTTRRTALAGALGSLALVVGCDLADLDPTSDPTPSDGDPSASEPAQDSDAALVNLVLGEVQELIELIGVERSKYPRLHPALTSLVDLHSAHLKALGGETVTAWTDKQHTQGPAAALTLIRARELRAQRRLADWSIAARSGALARLLASMSAAVAQQLIVLPPSPGGLR